jgi:hypothetical protein
MSKPDVFDLVREILRTPIRDLERAPSGVVVAIDAEHMKRFGRIADAQALDLVAG